MFTQLIGDYSPDARKSPSDSAQADQDPILIVARLARLATPPASACRIGRRYCLLSVAIRRLRCPLIFGQPYPFAIFPSERDDRASVWINEDEDARVGFARGDDGGARFEPLKPPIKSCRQDCLSRGRV
jgi:hypothetical protein